MNRFCVLSKFAVVGTCVFASLTHRAEAQDETKGECVQAVGTATPPAFDCGDVCDPPPGSGTCPSPPGGLEISWENGFCNGESQLPCSEFEVSRASSYTLTCRCSEATAHCTDQTIVRTDPIPVTFCGP